jgi:hypothetical protein
MWPVRSDGDLEEMVPSKVSGRRDRDTHIPQTISKFPLYFYLSVRGGYCPLICGCHRLTVKNDKASN